MAQDELGFRSSSSSASADGRGYAGGGGHGGDSAIGLELGKRTYFEAPSAGGGGGTVTQATPPSNGAPMKRARNGGVSAKCQVEGCKADLSAVKDYHRRHKVCPGHSKSPKVVVAGQEQRFCQQCSRFHCLSEFDEGKRSCRRRLAGHNERRRKPQPDALGFHARFLPAFQDNRRLGHLYSDSPFLHHIKLQGMSPLWDDNDGLNNGQRKSTWPPRMFKYGEPSSSLQCSLPTAGMGIEQLFLTGLQHQNDSRQLPFLPQSPKGMIPVSNDMTASKTNRYVQGSVSPMHQNMSLMSSGTGVLSGLEAIPVGQGFTRVSDSGCALSLQSNMQLWSSAQASVADSLDSTPSLMSDHDLHTTSIPVAEPLGQQHQLSWANDKLLSGAFSSHSISSANTIEKDSIDVQFSNGLSVSAGSYECLRLYSMLQGEDVQVGDMTEDVKQTIDLMQVACAPHGQSTEANVSSGSFDLGNCQFGDLQPFRSYGSSIFNS